MTIVDFVKELESSLVMCMVVVGPPVICFDGPDVTSAVVGSLVVDS